MRWQRLIFSILLLLFASSPAWASECTLALTKSYMGLFTLAMKTPYLTAIDIDKITNSPVPLAPLQNAPKNEYTQALKRAFANTIAQITPDTWPKIQEALRDFLNIKKAESEQLADAQKSTNFVFAGRTSVLETPNPTRHHMVDTHITSADRGPGDRLYFAGGAESLNVIEGKTKSVHLIPRNHTIASSIQIHQASPSRWLLLYVSTVDVTRNYSVHYLEFNPWNLTITDEKVLADKSMYKLDALDFQSIPNLEWVLSPDGELFYFFTNLGGTFFGRPEENSAPRRLNYKTGAEPLPAKILRMKNGRVLVATVGLDADREKYLMIFEPFKSLEPTRKLREPNMAYFRMPDLIQHNERVYVAISGSRKNPKKNLEIFTDIWDLSSKSKQIRSWVSGPEWVMGAPQFFETSSGRLLLAQRYQGSIYSFHMEIFAPLENNDPLYEIHTGTPMSPNAADNEHSPKLTENIYGDLLVAGIDRMEGNLVIFKPASSQHPAYTYNFGDSSSTSPAWSHRATGHLDILFSDMKGQTHLIEVMKED